MKFIAPILTSKWRCDIIVSINMRQSGSNYQLICCLLVVLFIVPMIMVVLV